MFPNIARQRRKERHFPRQLLPQRRRVQQSAPFHQVEKHLPIRPHLAGRRNSTTDRLRQSRMIDEGTILLCERRRRNQILRRSTDRRRLKVLHNERRHFPEDTRLLLRDPPVRSRGISRRQIQRLQLTCRLYYLLESHHLALEVFQHLLDPPAIRTLLGANRELDGLCRLTPPVLWIGVILADDGNRSQRQPHLSRQPLGVL